MNTRVSVIVPCYNEKGNILRLLGALGDQSFPRENMEVVVADGLSSDGTREELTDFARDNPNLKLNMVDNIKRSIPSALNTAIASSRGEVIIRLDAHSAPRQDYVERCLLALNESGAANVGGMWEIMPSTESWIARSIAVTAAHPLGAGDARYRIGGQAGEVETVPFGAYPREWLDRVGPFNESLLTNEDYEYNLRLRQAGGMVWFDPRIRSTYFARPNLISLLGQYARYGFWKAQMLRLHPGSLRWRQAAAPVFVITLLGLLFAGLIYPPAWALLAGVVLAYSAVVVTAGAVEAMLRRDSGLVIGVPLAFAVMHFGWGGAFLWGMMRSRVSGETAGGKS